MAFCARLPSTQISESKSCKNLQNLTGSLPECCKGGAEL